MDGDPGSNAHFATPESSLSERAPSLGGDDSRLWFFRKVPRSSAPTHELDGRESELLTCLERLLLACFLGGSLLACADGAASGFGSLLGLLTDL